MQTLHTILKPVVTEKAMKRGEINQYTFYVHPKATKIDVKIAVRELYGQEVESVKLMTTPLKKRTVGRREIVKRKKMRKAIVTLKGKKKIDVTKVTKEKPQKK